MAFVHNSDETPYRNMSETLLVVPIRYARTDGVRKKKMCVEMPPQHKLQFIRHKSFQYISENISSKSSSFAIFSVDNKEIGAFTIEVHATN